MKTQPKRVAEINNMSLLYKIILIIIAVKKADLHSRYDNEVIRSLGYSFKTLKHMNLASCSNPNERCAEQHKEINGPINDMGANAGFDSPNKVFRDTNKLMMDLAKEGSMLAKDTDDNYDELKYVFSLMQYFHLHFLKIYNKLLPTEDPKKVYDIAFDKALVKTNDHRIWDALQLAAPVRRVQYVLASVIDTLVEIVQSACSKDLLDWQCGARYYIMLAKETNRCPNIWYNHHKVFVETLKLVQNSQKTLLDVTKDVMATVDYMSSRRRVFDYENPYINRRDLNYDDYEYYINNGYDNVLNDHLGELKYEYNEASHPFKYAKNFQEYYDILDVIDDEMTRRFENKNSGVEEYVENMPYYDFRTEAGSKMNHKDFDDLGNIAEFRKSDDPVIHEAAQMISIGDDETEEEKKLQEELIRQNISDVVFFINSILMDRNTFDEKQSVKTVTKRAETKNELSEVDLTINKFLNDKVIPNLLHENDEIDDSVEDDDYESFYDDVKRRNILFDSSLKILHLYRHVLKDFLINKAEVYKLVDTYQKQNKLNCILIDYKPVI